MNNVYHQIAIDGFSSCGKSTLAKDLAYAIGFTHIDSGAMYRAVSLYLLENNISPMDLKAVDSVIEGITIDFLNVNGTKKTRLNNRVVEDEIREHPVSSIVSQVAVIESVRNRLVELQREMSKHHNVVMDGRDIGTVVFPHASIKLFITANIDIRVKRRWTELISKEKNITKEEVKKNLLLRDHIDSTRKIAPLKKADDAIEIDNSNLNRKEQLDLAIEIVKNKIELK